MLDYTSLVENENIVLKPVNLNCKCILNSSIIDGKQKLFVWVDI